MLYFFSASSIMVFTGVASSAIRETGSHPTWPRGYSRDASARVERIPIRL
jgi:hypothetical protein